MVIKSNGVAETFNMDKLLRSVERSDTGERDPKIYDHIKQEIHLRMSEEVGLGKEVSSKDIHNWVVDTLMSYSRMTGSDTPLLISNQFIMNYVHHRTGVPFKSVPVRTVVKRTGIKQHADLFKFRKKAEEACAGIDGVSPDELIVDSHIRWKEGITTEELHESMIKAAINKIDEPSPNWTFVAARLYLDRLYHNIGKLYGTAKGSPYPSLSQYIEMGMATGRLHSDFWKVYDLENLGKAIRPERDKNFTYIGVKTYVDRYALKTKGDIIELPQLTFMAVAMFLAHKEDDPMYWAEKFYNTISEFKVMPATPTLSNARTKRHQLSSCYVGVNDDSLTGIMDGYKEKAFLSKLGGGIGWDWSMVRACGGQIDGHDDVAKGVFRFIKIDNDIALAVDQLGTRKGAIATYLADWHMDIIDFLKMRDNGGEERNRAQDISPALWVSDEFMRRESNDEYWTLFDPNEVPHLLELYGDDFTKEYRAAEKNPKLRKIKIRARELFSMVMDSAYRHGMPFVCYKDTANRFNMNQHVGMIRSSNLCTEIFQVTEPDRNTITIYMRDSNGWSDVAIASEFERIVTSSGVKLAKNIQPGDLIDGMKVDSVEEGRTEGRTAICNLASINLPKVTSLSKEEFYDVVYTAMRMLDNVIDTNLYASKKIERTAKNSRAVGLGVMGEAEDLARRHIMFGSKEHEEYINRVYSKFEDASISASSKLADERGVYPEWRGSKWDTEVGIKMRNGYINAIAPTSSISIIAGTTMSTEPVFKRMWYEENMGGTTPVTAPNLAPDNYQYYCTAYGVDQMQLIKMAALRAPYIDQGISTNIFLDPKSITDIEDIARLYRYAWKMGVKSLYYLRSEAPELNEDAVIDRSFECTGCQ
jgi:ribonucleoside-diphosphate reductase alpha chain